MSGGGSVVLQAGDALVLQKRVPHCAVNLRSPTVSINFSHVPSVRETFSHC
jgi:hypothetical protein